MVSNIEAGKRIAKLLSTNGYSKDGVIGILANLYAESGFRSNNLQNSYEKSLGMTDDQYVAAVDDGSYGNFVYDKAGFGLAQWTYWSRKKTLLDHVRSAKVSIADESAQVDVLINELKHYISLNGCLKSTTNFEDATRRFMKEFERPADLSEAAQLRRVGYAKEIAEALAKSDLQEAVVSITDEVTLAEVTGSDSTAELAIEPIKLPDDYPNEDYVEEEHTMGFTFTRTNQPKEVAGIVFDYSKPCHSGNYNDKASRTVNSVHIHYTGNSKDTAWANANFYQSSGGRGASAHLFIDEGSKCYVSVPLCCVAWANSNRTVNQTDISIEMACSGNYTVSEKTKINTAKVAAWLLTKMGYKPDQLPNKTILARHHDAAPNKKECPKQMSRPSVNNAEWNAFVKMVKQYMAGGSVDTTLASVQNATTSANVVKPVYPEVPFSAKVTKAAALKVRYGPGTTYRVMREPLKKGDEIKIIDTSENGWGKLEDGGWCSLSYCEIGKHVEDRLSGEVEPDVNGATVANNTVVTQALTSTSVRPADYRVRIAVDVLNVRTGPGTDFPIAKDAKGNYIKAKRSGVYTIVQTTGRWGKLKSGAGWIHLGYTKVVESK